jgi:prophage regulatory protein
MADTIPVLIPRRRVSELTGLQRTALYARIARGTFPRPVTIGSAAVRWVEAEVVAWVQAQIDASRKPAISKNRKG